MKIKSHVVFLIAAVFVFGGIFVADQLGLWQTEAEKVPMKFTEGAFEGESNPDDIRGSYSFSDIENAFGVKAEMIATAFNLQVEDVGNLKAKDIETYYSGLDEDIEVGTGSVKKFVSLYTGLPYSGDDYLPQTAIEVLKTSGVWNESMAGELEGFILEIDAFVPFIDQDIQSENEEEHEEDIAIKGKTTISDALSYGIPLEEIELILGVEIPNENMLIRDLCTQNGLNFSEVKAALNALLVE